MGIIRKIGKIEQACLQAAHADIQQHCKATGDKQYTIAEECGMSASELSKCLNCDDMVVAADLKAKDLFKICMLTGGQNFGTEFARVLSAIWIKRPDGSPKPDADLERCVREFADLIGSYNGEFSRFEKEALECVAAIYATIEAKRVSNVTPMKGAM